jgi:hypothetical protein
VLTLIQAFRGLVAAGFLGPMSFCGVVATLDRGQPLVAVVCGIGSWGGFFGGIGLLFPRWFERHYLGAGNAIAALIVLATAVLFLPELLARVR